MRTFIDTNVLVYARDATDPQKKAAARNWLNFLSERSAAVVNLQVLNEFCHVALRQRDVSLADVRAETLAFREWGETVVDLAIHDEAWRLREATRYQWFDCILLASALRESCAFFLTEDMDHLRRINDLTILNPFKITPHDAFRRQ